MTTIHVDYELVGSKVEELAAQCEEVGHNLEGDYLVSLVWPDSDIVRYTLSEIYQEGYERGMKDALSKVPEYVGEYNALLEYVSTLQVREATLTEEVVRLKVKLYDTSEQINNLLTVIDEEADAKIKAREELAQARRDLITKPED